MKSDILKYNLRILILLFLNFSPVYSFYICAQNRQTSLYFNNLRQENGLPSNITNSIVQDNLGFIWIGTGNGICRYDGYSTIIFKNEGQNRLLPTNNISCLLLDGDTLWVGTWKGLCYINTKTLKVNNVNLGPETPIRCLYKSLNNKIWIGTSNGILVYDKKNSKYEFHNNINSALSHSTIRCFYQTADSTMWIGTYNKLNKFKDNLFTSFDLKGNYKPFLKNNLILDICPMAATNDSVLLIGTETGLAVFNTISGKSHLYNNENTNLSNEVIKCIYSKDDKLWLGTDFGLSIFNLKDQTASSYFHNPIINHSITNNVIWDIFEDCNHVIWLLTSNGISMINLENPLFQLHEEFFHIEKQEAGNQIRDILITKDNTLFLATIHGIIAENKGSTKKTLFTSQSDEAHKLLLDNSYNLLEDCFGQIWMATAGGINIWNPKTEKMYAISSNKTNGLTSNYISSFAITNDNTIWVNAWEGGIFKSVGDIRKPNPLHFLKVENTIPDCIYACENSIFYSSENKLWKIDNTLLTAEAVDIINDSINEQTILCLNTDKNNSLWIATDKQFINYTPAIQKTTCYPIKSTIINHPLCMEIDNNERIWMATINTVIYYDLQTAKTFAVPLNPNYPLKNFYNRCSTISPSGTVFFGGDNGYVETIQKNNNIKPVKPKAVISSIRINNEIINSHTSSSFLKQDIAYTDTIKLNYSNNSITFYFSCLDYWLPNKNNYNFRLVNFDNNWRNTQDGNFATYANLRPGNYTLELESVNSSGMKSEDKTQLLIKIYPPLWLSLPFVCAYILFFLGLLYFIFRVYTKRQQLTNELRLSNMEKIHSQEVFNSKQQFFTNISHEFRTPLSLITPPIKQVIESGVLKGNNLEMLKLAERNSQRLLKLINQILDFRKLETHTIPINIESVEIIGFCHEIFESFNDIAIRKLIHYNFIAPKDYYVTYIDKEKTEAILYNLLANAFKHSFTEGIIEINIQILPEGNTDTIKISVSDTGEGILPENLHKIFNQFYQAPNVKQSQQGTGIGLAMAKQYAHLHNGDITVDSMPDKGSVFTYAFKSQKNKNSNLNFKEEIKVNEPIRKNDTISSNKSPVQNRLLIIDDNPDILNYVEMNLSSQFEIIKASNGKEGFEKAIQLKPLVIVSDIMMPIMNGLEMCKKLKDNYDTQHIPVILLTAKSLDVQKTEGIESGANLYITKPFDIHYLIACINGIISREKQIIDFLKKELLIHPQNNQNGINNQDELFLKKVMEIIAENISNADLSVEMISDQIGMSSTHLYRKLKLITNQSTKDILKNYRMQKAAQMIKNNEGNITEIMYHVGFNSLSSFSKSFKSSFGVSPKEYR